MEHVGHGHTSETMVPLQLEMRKSMHETKLSENTETLEYKTGNDTTSKLFISSSKRWDEIANCTPQCLLI